MAVMEVLIIVQSVENVLLLESSGFVMMMMMELLRDDCCCFDSCGVDAEIYLIDAGRMTATSKNGLMTTMMRTSIEEKKKR